MILHSRNKTGRRFGSGGRKSMGNVLRKENKTAVIEPAIYSYKRGRMGTIFNSKNQNPLYERFYIFAVLNRTRTDGAGWDITRHCYNE